MNQGTDDKGIIGGDDVKDHATKTTQSGDNMSDEEGDRKPAARKKAPIEQGTKKKTKVRDTVDSGKGGNVTATKKQRLTDIVDEKEKSGGSSETKSPKKK